MDNVVEASQLSPELLGGIMALNPTIHGDSSPRSAMFGSHIGQCVVIEGSEPRMMKTGVEYEYGKQTFKVVAPCDMRITNVFKRFEETYGYNAIKKNPEIYVIYERLTNKTRNTSGMNVFGVLKIPTYHTKNHALGFKYVLNKKALQLLRPGNIVQEGTVFAQSPNLTETGDYKYGINANVAFMSTPEAEQDGFVVTDEFAERLACTKIESRIVSWGENKILLNLYGDDTVYKAYPDIGECIRPDGLLFAIRTIRPGFGITSMTPKALRTINPIFDELVYAEAGAEIINVNIKSDRMRTGRQEVQFYDKQSEKYESASRVFSKNIRDMYERMSRQHPKTLVLENELNLLITDAISDTGGLDRKLNAQGQIISMDKGAQIYNKVPIGDWRAEVSYVKRLKAGVRFKLTDTHGGKGVIVKVIPKADAPVDEYGNVADVIMDDGSITKRMNLGKPAEQWINGASRWVHRNVKQFVSEGKLDEAWDYLLGYYKAAAYEQYELMSGGNYNDQAYRHMHVNWVAEHGVELWTPTDRKYYGAEQIRRIMKNYDYPITPVTYRAPNGEFVKTKDPVLIAPLYIILLEKMGEYWASCSFPKLTHFGTLAPLTQSDKYALPWRNAGTRFTGESEIRLIVAACGGRYANRILSFANTPSMHRSAMYKLLRAENPMQLKSVIDEKETPLGQSRPLNMYKHIQNCRGIRLGRTKSF
ncbi:DNA-directed RNA polymerase subunit alpha [Proteus phage 10]|nr:DNA-directed RNA polymerase subunit alpha [Proteus phage 10]